MRWIRALLITLGTVAIIWLCLNLEVTSAPFAWVLNFILMAWFTLVETQLKPALRSRYFESYGFENKGRIYELLGVHGYRWLLRASGWEKISKANNPIRKTLPALQQFERATRVSETGHALIAFIVLAFAVFVSVEYSVREALWLLGFNIPLNIYPIMVQRYNRPRLRRAIRQFANRTTSAAAARGAKTLPG